VGRAVQPRPGSALRFFQPLSGFQADSSFVALFHATAVRVSPFRVFPSQESPTLSGQASSLAVIHSRAVTTPTRGHDTFGFTYSRAFAQSHGSPVTGIGPCLSTSQRPASRQTPGPRMGDIAPSRELHLLRSFHPPASPFTSTTSCPVTTVDTLLSLCLSEVFPQTPRDLKPARYPEPVADHVTEETNSLQGRVRSFL